MPAKKPLDSHAIQGDGSRPNLAYVLVSLGAISAWVDPSKTR